MLAMELTSNRMSRLGKSLITDSELLSLDRVIAEIEAVDATAVAQLAKVLLEPAKLSVAGIGPSGAPARAVERFSRTRDRSRRLVRILLFERGGEWAPCSARSSPRRATSSPTSSAATAFLRRPGRGDRLHASRRGARQRGALSGRGPPASSGPRPQRGRSHRPGREGEGEGRRVFRRAELRARRRPHDALRRRSRQAHAEGRDRRAASRGEARPSGTAKATAELLPGEVPIHSVRLPGLLAHQEVIFGGRANAHHPPRHAVARGVRAGRALAPHRLPTLPAGVTVGLDALL